LAGPVFLAVKDIEFYIESRRISGVLFTAFASIIAAIKHFQAASITETIKVNEMLLQFIFSIAFFANVFRVFQTYL
jgi:uncharacterized protein YqhQ